MKPKFTVISTIVASALLWAPLTALAQSGTVTIDLTGVKNTSVQALGDYAGYYTGTVNSVASQPGFICDDYKDNVYVGESWQATAISFSSLATSTTALNSTLFGKTIGVDGYAAIAYLANLMATTSASGQGAISAAIWYIGALSNSSSTGNYNSLLKAYDSISWSSLSTAAQSYVTSLLGSSGIYGTVGGDTQSAINELLASTNLWLYVPTSWSGSRPQEFIGYVAVPEGGATLLYLLLAALTCGGVLYFRRREMVPAVKENL